MWDFTLYRKYAETQWEEEKEHADDDDEDENVYGEGNSRVDGGGRDGGGGDVDDA